MSEALRSARGLLGHMFLVLELNFRSRQAIVYGYLVPLLFLVAFGSVFRAEEPALLGQMGQLITITICPPSHLRLLLYLSNDRRGEFVSWTVTN